MDPQLPGDGVENDHYIPHSHFDDYSSDLAAYFELVEKEMIEISEDEEYVKDLIRKQNLTTAEEDESENNFQREHELTFDSHLETDDNKRVSGIQEFIETTLKVKFKPLKTHLFGQLDIEAVLQDVLQKSRWYALNEVRRMFEEPIKNTIQATLENIEATDDFERNDASSAQDTSNGLQALVASAVEAFWVHQLVIFKEVIDAHFDNMIGEKHLLAEELFSLMDENMDGKVTFKEFLHVFTKEMTKVLPSAVFFANADRRIQKVSWHARASKAQLVFHLSALYFKTLGQKIKTTLQMNCQSSSSRTPEHEKPNGKCRSWLLLNGASASHGLRKFLMYLQRAYEVRGMELSGLWKIIWNRQFTQTKLTSKSAAPMATVLGDVDAIPLYVDKSFILLTTGAKITRSNLNVLYDDIDQDYFKDDAGIHYHEFCIFLMLYLNQMKSFMFKLLIAVMEANLRDIVRKQLLSVGNRAELSEVDGVERDAVLVILHQCCKRWKTTLANFFENMAVDTSGSSKNNIYKFCFEKLCDKDKKHITKNSFVSKFEKVLFSYISSVSNKKHLSKLLEIDFVAAICTLSETERVVTSETSVSKIINAIEYGDVESLEALLNEDLCNVQCNKKGHRPMHIAISFGWKPVVERLCLYTSCDVNAKTKQHKVTPLHIAVSKGYKDIISILLRNGADVNSQDYMGMTPLHYAVDKQNKGILQQLASQPGVNLSVEALSRGAGESKGLNVVEYAKTIHREDLVELITTA